MAKNSVHARTKHIKVHYHFVRERVLHREFELWYVRTNRQIADIFTKALDSKKLQHFSELFGVQLLDVPHLKGRMERGTDPEETSREKKIETGAEKGSPFA